MQVAVDVALITNPAVDAEFRSRAEACLADGAVSPGRLQRCLRPDYPKVLVHDGITERGIERWYAYREGHWIGAGESGAQSERAAGP